MTTIMHETFSITTNDNLHLFAQSYTVENPEFVVCLIHGMGEHSSRYEHVAQFFNANQISLYTMDLRGHGKSEGKRGHMPSYENMMQDINELVEAARLQNKQIPVFLYGHSMGGNLALNYAIRYGDNINGVIATSPYLKLAFEPPAWKVKLAKLIKNIFPSIAQSTGLDANFLSKDKKNIETYLNDPLVHEKITPSFFIEIEEAASFALQNAANLKVPALIIHGSDDKITDPFASETFAAQNAQKCTFKLYQGGFHELHNDEEQSDLLDKISKFIRKNNH